MQYKIPNPSLRTLPIKLLPFEADIQNKDFLNNKPPLHHQHSFSQPIPISEFLPNGTDNNNQKAYSPLSYNSLKLPACCFAFLHNSLRYSITSDMYYLFAPNASIYQQPPYKQKSEHTQVTTLYTIVRHPITTYPIYLKQKSHHQYYTTHFEPSNLSYTYPKLVPTMTWHHFSVPVSAIHMPLSQWHAYYPHLLRWKDPNYTEPSYSLYSYNPKKPTENKKPYAMPKTRKLCKNNRKLLYFSLVHATQHPNNTKLLHLQDAYNLMLSASLLSSDIALPLPYHNVLYSECQVECSHHNFRDRVPKPLHNKASGQLKHYRTVPNANQPNTIPLPISFLQVQQKASKVPDVSRLLSYMQQAHTPATPFPDYYIDSFSNQVLQYLLVISTRFFVGQQD